MDPRQACTFSKEGALAASFSLKQSQENRMQLPVYLFWSRPSPSLRGALARQAPQERRARSFRVFR